MSDERAYVTTPEAVGDLSKPLVVKVDTDENCPMHSQNWLYAAVRNNRRLSGLEPQRCACPTPIGGREDHNDNEGEK